METPPPEPAADTKNDDPEAASLEGPATAGDTPPPEPTTTEQQKDTQTKGSDTDSPEVVDATQSASPAATAPPPNNPESKRRPLQILQATNIYLLLFILVLLVALGVAVATYTYSKKQSNTTVLHAGTLSQSTLDQLATSDASVGSSGQVLNVQSSAIFAGKVLVRNSLAVAGDLQIGGTLSLTGISVSGTGTINQLQVAQNLAVSGDNTVQGNESVHGNLAVAGSGNFSGPLSVGQLTVTNLQLNGDLTTTHHITAGGSTPSRSNGPALGSGGTASLSGSDTSGTLSVNTGGSPAAGCFATVTFAAKFNSTPHVIITPVGSAAGGLSYYVNRSPTNFSICVATPAPASSSFAFDYFVLD